MILAIDEKPPCLDYISKTKVSEVRGRYPALSTALLLNMSGILSRMRRDKVGGSAGVRLGALAERETFILKGLSALSVCFVFLGGNGTGGKSDPFVSSSPPCQVIA
jgi:hypothetical protein